jgi:DNA-binding LacI/PurR family transcriptional regulator
VIGAERFVAGAMHAIADAGLDVPDDMLVAAAVDGNHARSSTPPLTAIDLQPEQKAAVAATLLWRRLDGEAPQGQQTVPGFLRVRESTIRTKGCSRTR